jgi:serine/threonine protein kinase
MIKINNENPNIKYKIGRIIGFGGTGKVYRCRCYNTKKIFAVKIMLKSDTNLEEIQLWSKIPKHKNILELIEVFIWEDNIFAIMELMAYSMAAIIPSNERHISLLSPQMILNICYQLIQAVKFLHDNQIAHCDIKSDNILFDSNGILKLADFGVSTENNQIHKNAPFIGTLWWSSPNSLKISTACPMKDDIWSLAVTILELLGIDPPFFHIKDTKQAFQYIQNLTSSQMLPKLQNYDNNFSHRITGLLQECFRIDPNERFSSDELLRFFEMIFEKKYYNISL